MKICPNCGFKEVLNWRYSRFDYNTEYLRLDEAPKELIDLLPTPKSHVELNGYIYYRRGTGGLYIYRVLPEDYKINRERKKH